MTAYYLWLAGSALLCTLLFGLSLKQHRKRGSLCACALLLGTLLGTVMAKLVYNVAQADYLIADGLGMALIDPDPARWSFFGGCAGVSLGVWLAAKLLKEEPWTVLNAFAPAGALMAALARFGGYFLQEQMIGLGDCTYNEAVFFFPLTVTNEWGEHYWALFMLEGLCSLAAAAVVFRLKKERFLSAVYLLCLPQLFCELLNSSSYYWFFFIRVEQVLALVGILAVLIAWCRKSAPQRGGWRPLLLAVLCAGVIAAAEYGMDKLHDVPQAVLYGMVLLSIAGLFMIGRAARLRAIRNSV